MEESERLKKHFGHRLGKVDVKVSGAQVDSSLIHRLLSPVTQALDVQSLHHSILTSLKSLSLLEAYKRCSVTVYPGNQENTALVEYQLRFYRWWSLLVALSSNREGGSVSMGLNLRNMRQRADLTRNSFEYKPNTGTWGVNFQHIDPMLRPGKWGLSLDFHSRERVLDLNLKTWEMGQFFVISNYEKSSLFKFGREVRTNYLGGCGVEMLRKALLTSEKYYMSYTYRNDTRNSPLQPTSGHLLECRGELSTVQGRHQAAFDLTGKLYHNLTKGAVLELSAAYQSLHGLNGKDCHVNDKPRGSFVKGFRTYGERVPVRTGDDLGVPSLLSTEAKLSFHRSPLLHDFNLTPFLYLNLHATHLSSPQFRGSAGVGIDWITHFGRVEMSYAAKVVSQAGDLPVHIQFLLSE